MILLIPINRNLNITFGMPIQIYNNLSLGQTIVTVLIKKDKKQLSHSKTTDTWFLEVLLLSMNTYLSVSSIAFVSNAISFI